MSEKYLLIVFIGLRDIARRDKALATGHAIDMLTQAFTQAVLALNSSTLACIVSHHSSWPSPSSTCSLAAAADIRVSDYPACQLRSRLRGSSFSTQLACKLQFLLGSLVIIHKAPAAARRGQSFRLSRRTGMWPRPSFLSLMVQASTRKGACIQEPVM